MKLFIAITSFYIYYPIIPLFYYYTGTLGRRPIWLVLCRYIYGSSHAGYPWGSLSRNFMRLNTIRVYDIQQGVKALYHDGWFVLRELSPRFEKHLHPRRRIAATVLREILPRLNVSTRSPSEYKRHIRKINIVYAEHHFVTPSSLVPVPRASALYCPSSQHPSAPGCPSRCLDQVLTPIHPSIIPREWRSCITTVGLYSMSCHRRKLSPRFKTSTPSWRNSRHGTAWDIIGSKLSTPSPMNYERHRGIINAISERSTPYMRNSCKPYV